MARHKEAPDELNENQKAFCYEYIFDWNGSRAYKMAYQDVTDETARVNASKLLTNTNIKAFIDDIQKDLEKTAGISRLKVIREHQKIAFSSIANLHDTWITRKEFDKLSQDQKDCISEIQTQTRIEKDYSNDPEGTPMQVDYVKIKLYDKQKSLDSISKMLGYDAAKKVDLNVKGVKSYKIVPASERIGRAGNSDK